MGGALLALAGAVCPVAAQTGEPAAAPSFDIVQFFQIDHPRNAERARACALFDRMIDPDAAPLSDFVQVTPAADISVSAQGQQMCIDGLAAGTTYDIMLSPGIPGRDGGRSVASGRVTLAMPDLWPSLGFAGGRYVLPRLGARGLPLQSVNVDTAALTLIRVPERNLIQLQQESTLEQDLYPYRLDNLKNFRGETLWQGELPIDGGRNRRTMTVVGLADLLAAASPAPGGRPRKLETGLYVLTAVIPGADGRRDPVASQWFVVSDLGLTVLRGDAGTEVQVRSLESARPVAGVTVTLYGRNNEALDRGISDADGLVRFAPGRMAGGGGRTPQAITAMNGPGAASADSTDPADPADPIRHGDFTFLNLTGAPFDLSDRGVGGVPHPGPLDAFLYAGRGVYRPGETAELVALLRDAGGAAVTGLPLTLVLVAPDGSETRRMVVADAGGGGHPLTLPFPRTARTGAWTVRAHAEPDAPPIGSLTFLVEDVVPAKIEVGLSLDSAAVRPDTALSGMVQADFLYGAPAGGLKAAATVTVRQDLAPFPDWTDYRFGPADDPVRAVQTRVDLAATDKAGRTALDLPAIDLPDTPQFLKATLRVDVFEPGGRPVVQSAVLPVRDKPFAIGIKALFDARVGDGAEAGFEVVTLDSDGTRIARPELNWRLVREDWDYRWFRRGIRWDYEVAVTDNVLETGRLDVAADRPAALARRVSWGRYRLEIYDADSVTASSVRFTGGWWVAPGLGTTPDRLVVRPDRERYAVGERVILHVEAPFAGDLEVVVATDRVLSRHRMPLTADGSRVTLPVTEAWGTGAYLLATAYRPGDSDGDGDGGATAAAPGRAIGVSWVPVSRPERRLEVALSVPDLARPKQALRLPVRLAGLQPGERGFVTVAAVDEGVLQLTRFASPDPRAHLFGQRQLRLTMRDLYGRLIDDRDGVPGRPRSGGDALDLASNNAPEPTIAITSLFSGIVAADRDGRAEVGFDLPDHNGRLRIMAVAWSASGVGAAEAALVVRAPLVAQLAMPRFLTVGDTASLTLRLQNLDAPAGDYRVRLRAAPADPTAAPADPTAAPADPTAAPDSAPIRLVTLASGDAAGSSPDRAPGSATAPAAVTLASGDAVTLRIKVAAERLGVGALTATLDGPDGFRLVRDWRLPTRPPALRARQVEVGRLEPGHAMGFSLASLTGRLGDSIPGTAEARFNVARQPPIDVPGLLVDLDRYPYGCLEQTVSRAIPLLYFNAVADQWGIDPGTEIPAVRLQRAINRVLTMQTRDGSFVLWPRTNYTRSLWITAYAVDFLQRADALGYPVPAGALDRAIGALRSWSNNNRTGQPADLAAKAYAIYVLSRTAKGAAANSRYLFEARLSTLPTPLARAMVAAALARHGDLPRARRAMVAAFEFFEEQGQDQGQAGRPLHFDFGTRLRDAAALVAIAAETEAEIPDFRIGDRIARTLRRAIELYADRRWHSTQEQSWLLLAAHALGRNARGRNALDRNDDRPEADGAGGRLALELLRAGQSQPVEAVAEYRVALDADALARGLVVRNAGPDMVWWTESMSSLPVGDDDPVFDGIEIDRTVMTLDGRPARLDRVRQTEALVVVLTGRVTTDLREQVLVVDPMPAGFEPENAAVQQQAALGLDWLGPMTRTVYAEQRDDRFVAAFDPGGRGAIPALPSDGSPPSASFRLAYMVRAVTPGTYIYPSAVAEHMYRPERRGRTGAQSVTVVPFH